MKVSSVLLFIIQLIVFSIKLHSQWACGYNNTFYQNLAAPTVSMQTVTQTCVYGGEYVRVTGLQAGKTYKISTCGNTNFDTQISIYTAGGALELAYNDDWCGTQSAIFFTPLTTGNYDVLIDEFNCSNNSICMDLNVQLWYNGRQDITIPVVVHVLYNNASENISDAQIQSQIDVLNQAFTRTNPDIYNVPSPFLGISMDPMIQFCLAVRDPNGNPTNGITRTYTPFTNFNIPVCCNATQCVFDNTLGGHDPWNPNKYLNIWVCNMTGSTLNGTIGLGFAPNQSLLGPLAGIGIITDYRAIGTIGTATAPLNLGKNVVHEVGHWLNLWHVWGLDSHTPNSNCSSDSVPDTPWQDGATFGIPSFPLFDFCTPGYAGVNFNNYMDYSNDLRRNMFTYEQVVRTDGAIWGPYYSLQSSLGCTPGPVPNTNFVANVTSGIAPLSVNFTDLSTNSPTSWEWTFYGGASPSSSTLQNPSGITWNSTGLKSVKLIATNAWGSDTEQKSGYINVVSGVGIEIDSVQNAIITIFPNPAKNQLNINCFSCNEYSNVEILNSLGQLVLNTSVSFSNNDPAVLDISSIANGVYWLRIKNTVSMFIKE